LANNGPAYDKDEKTPFKITKSDAVVKDMKTHSTAMELDHPRGSIRSWHFEPQLRQLLDALMSHSVDELVALYVSSFDPMLAAGMVTAFDANGLKIYNDAGTAGLWVKDDGSVEIATIVTTLVKALGAGGITFKDDGNNTAITIADGGAVTIGSLSITTLTSNLSMATYDITCDDITADDITCDQVAAAGAGGLLLKDDGGNTGLTLADGGAVTANVSLASPTISGTTSVATPIVKAAGAAGLRIEDDGGNAGVFIKDGGLLIGMGGNVAPAYACDVTGTAKMSLGCIPTDILTTSGSWKTQNNVFDFLAPYIPNTNDIRQCIGMFASPDNTATYNAHKVERTGSTTIKIHFYSTSYTVTDGSATNHMYNGSLQII
jgi:hypothetical protein